MQLIMNKNIRVFNRLLLASFQLLLYFLILSFCNFNFCTIYFFDTDIDYSSYITRCRTVIIVTIDIQFAAVEQMYFLSFTHYLNI